MPVHESVRMAVDFLPAGTTNTRRVRPLAFLWGGRKYAVKRVNLVYKVPHGNRYRWSFAVSDEANSYVFLYDPEDMSWTLEEVYAL